jgi:hypothetical protein
VNTCELCYDETRNRKSTPVGQKTNLLLLCNECRRHVEYYDSLTLVELAEEHRMMTEYFATREMPDI